MNQDYEITVEIYCLWQGMPKSYRIYIDDDLLTERTYIWNNLEQHIKEIIIVNLSPGIHSFRLESAEPGFKKFNYSNFKINNKTVVLNNSEFTI